MRLTNGEAMTKNTLCLLLVGLSVAGCASFANTKRSAVTSRATFDLSCPTEKLQLTPLSSEAMDRATYGVAGCGKKATYVYVPGIGAALNSPVEAASVASADAPRAN